jgi:NitT/TauT family transport system ATP-binding protein
MDMACGLEAVDFSYGEKQVLKGFTLALPATGSVCLFGPSGCGKTTALRLLAGLERPQAGRVVGLEGRCIAMMFQEDRLLPWCTLRENLLLGMGKGAQSQAALEWLETVGLGKEAGSLPGALSGGMRRRAALARALARNGDVLLLDEPLKELDAANALRLRPLILEHARDKLLVLITHDRQEAEALCQRIVPCDGPPLRMV